MYVDDIIEGSGLILENLNVTTTGQSSWTSGSSSYGFYRVNYKERIFEGRKYYFRCIYKYTTTNQSPTWCRFYQSGGSVGTDAYISNPTAGAEYTMSTIFTEFTGYGHGITTLYGNIYNGSSNAISGVTAYVKNALVYDVTELAVYLGITDNTALKTWCDNNLVYKAPGVLYDLGAKTRSNIAIKGGIIAGDTFIEADGMYRYAISTSLRDYAYFDKDGTYGDPLYIYNNNGNGTVTHTAVSAASVNSPFDWSKHPYCLKITTSGSASPGAGGFYTNHSSKANGIFIERFVAKIPVGYTVNAHYNSQGTGASISFITPRDGTGDWAEYAILYKCGSEGTFSTGGHVAISGSDNTSVTWYLAYVSDYDITGNEYLKNFSVLPNRTKIQGPNIFVPKFDCTNLLPNGDLSVKETAMLPSGWSYDDTDYAGKSHRCIVQPVGAGSGYFGSIRIDPTIRYKISLYIKCKQDMTSFLIPIEYYTSDNVLLHHTVVSFVNGTKTTLSADLVSGATSMTVASNNNWIDRSYSRLGFRSNSWISYNNKGTGNSNGSTGFISGVTGSNIVNFKIAYSGSTIPAGTYVVESYDGGTFPYPIGKGNLPTDNTWKYCEGYFGPASDGYSSWDGRGGDWAGIPAQTAYATIGLNLYSNTGTVPIKYSDIRIEPVGSTAAKCRGSRNQQKIQLKGVL